MKKLIIFITPLLFTIQGWSQSEINNYKYVVVPLQYEFLKGQDMYRLNTLTKFLFKENGFDTYFTKQKLPDDLFKDRCLAMYADLEEGNGFRRTKLTVLLRDCHGELIFKSDVGDSGNNVHQERYHEALREAFQSFKRLNYKYNSEADMSETIVEGNANEDSKEDVKVEVTEKIIPETEAKVEVKEPKEVIAEKEMKAKAKKPMPPPAKEKRQILQAVAIGKGFKLVDANSKLVMTLFETAAQDVYVVKGKNAIVYKEEGKWKYSENDGNFVMVRELNLKF